MNYELMCYEKKIFFIRPKISQHTTWMMHVYKIQTIYTSIFRFISSNLREHFLTRMFLLYNLL